MRKEIDYRVFVNGNEIDLYRVAVSYTPEKDEPPVLACRYADDGNCYGIGTFDSDEPVQVEIRCRRSLAQTVILPENSIFGAQISAEKITFKLTKHGSYIFEPERYKDTPLILFFKHFTNIGYSSIWYAMMISNILIMFYSRWMAGKITYEIKVKAKS